MEKSENDMNYLHHEIIIKEEHSDTVEAEERYAQYFQHENVNNSEPFVTEERAECFKTEIVTNVEDTDDSNTSKKDFSDISENKKGKSITIILFRNV